MDFKFIIEKLLTVFKEQDIQYALIGGLALGLWGVPRATVDIQQNRGVYNRKTKQETGKKNKQPSLWSKISKWQWEHLWLTGSV